MNKKQEKIFFDSILNDDLKKVKEIVKEGADVNHRDALDRTPISLAISKGNIKMAKFLLANGAEMNTYPDNSGDPLLVIAVRNIDAKAVQFLVKNGVDTAAKDNQQRTAADIIANPDIPMMMKLKKDENVRNLKTIAEILNSKKNINKDKYIKQLKSSSKKKHAYAKRMLGISENSIILVCPDCGALFHDNDANLSAQWGLLKGGGAIGGGLIIHCPSCKKQASIQDYFRSSRAHNP